MAVVGTEELALYVPIPSPAPSVTLSVCNPSQFPVIGTSPSLPKTGMGDTASAIPTEPDAGSVLKRNHSLVDGPDAVP